MSVRNNTQPFRPPISMEHLSTTMNSVGNGNVEISTSVVTSASAPSDVKSSNKKVPSFLTSKLL